MHGSEWTLKYDEPEVENVALVHSRDNLSSTSWMHFSAWHADNLANKVSFLDSTSSTIVSISTARRSTSSFDIKAGNIFSSQVAAVAVLRIHVLAETSNVRMSNEHRCPSSVVINPCWWRARICVNSLFSHTCTRGLGRQMINAALWKEQVYYWRLCLQQHYMTLRWKPFMPEWFRCTLSLARWLEPKTLRWCRQNWTPGFANFLTFSFSEILVGSGVVLRQSHHTWKWAVLSLCNSWHIMTSVLP